MQFRNKTNDALYSDKPSGRFEVEPGEVLNATDEQAAGLVLQCGPDANWEPADKEAADAVAAATGQPTAKTPPVPAPPADTTPSSDVKEND